MKQFIGEEIKVAFDKDFILEKKPPCPTSFVWRGEMLVVKELISSWLDFDRKGKKARNMRDAHLARARIKGSWGVGRIYFQVRVELDKIAVIYYDRSPRNVFDKKGIWVLFSIEQ